MITPHVIKLCVLVEGGPGAAFEAQQFCWNGNYVIPVRVTGGAAGGLFNVPQAIFQKPPCIDESVWSVLGDQKATPIQVAKALVRIVHTLIQEDLKVGSYVVPRGKKKASVQRSATFPYSYKLPAAASSSSEDKVHRTLSES